MIFQTTSQAYRGMLELVLNKYDFRSSPRGHDTIEKLNVQFTVRHPDSEPIVTKDHKRNVVIANYTKKEFDWYDKGDRTVQNAPTKMWETLADREGNINSNYGHLLNRDESEGSYLEMNTDNLLNSVTTPYLRTPKEWALLSLKNDRNSRQAVLRINKPKHTYVGNKDFPCTMYLNTHIRNDRLYLTVRMRSNDLTTGLVYDLPYFCKIQDELIQEFNEISDRPVEKGSLTFSADSMHIYERDMGKISKMLNGEISESKF